MAYLKLTGSELRQLILHAAEEKDNPVYQRLIKFYHENEPEEFKRQLMIIELENAALVIKRQADALEWHKNYQNFLMECKNYKVSRNPTYIQMKMFGLPPDVPELDADLEKLLRILKDLGTTKRKLESVEKFMTLL